MKINKLKINAYGKLQDKELNLSKNINVIYGKNESGKSTIIKFLINSFYGTSKNKKGKGISDYEQYKPWNTDEFSGKLEYELDNGENYEIYREFSKKNPKIFNENSEDISKQFNIDKNKGNEFFYEQTKIDEELFLATSAILQEDVRLEKNIQNKLVQKITNIIGTGSDNVSYKRAIERLGRRQLEEIGTERTREKPINIVEQKIQNLKAEKDKLMQYESLKYEINNQKEKIIKNIFSDKIKYQIIKELKQINQQEKIEQEKIKINEKIKEENSEKINKIKRQINEIKDIENKKIKENNKKIEKENNKFNKIINIIFFILLLINILWYSILNKNIQNKIIKNAFIITIPMFLIFKYFYQKNKNNKIIKNNSEENKIINNLENEINILEKNKIEIEEKIEKNKIENNIKTNSEKEKIKNNYKTKIENYELNNLLKMENKLLENEEEKIKEKINNQELELHKLNFNGNDIENKYNELLNIEENLCILKEEFEELKKLNASMNLVKEILLEAYEEMQNSVSPKLTEQLSKNISEITDRKYNKVKFNDEQGMIVEVENGNYILGERLSTGTIDQLYLSLRLAMLDEITEEKIPIIFDEAFAHFDDDRLENILKYLNSKYSNRQIILFTCNDREINILNKLKIKYNLINL